MTSPPSAAPQGQVGWPCPRCGTLFAGNFCPRCGLPRGAWAPRPAPASSARPILTILWTLAIAGFVLFAITDFAGLAVSPSLVVPNIQGMRSDQTVNSGMDFNGNWTFDQWGTASSPSYQASGGNPDGFIEMTLFGTGDRGYFWQAFNVSGSRPYTGVLRLDVRTAGALTSGRLLISVDSSPILDPTTAVAIVPYSGPTGWTSTGRVSVDPKIVAPGQYYLKVGFWVDGATGAVDVGLDNVRLTWTTDAGVVLYVPAPLPLVVFVSQDKTVFLSYYALIAAAIFLFGGFYAVRDRRETLRVLKAPIEAIGTRLRSRSAWIAIGQVWMAVTFFQVAVIFVLGLIGFEPTTPINITQDNAWVFLFDLANAGVYEELVFRLLLIGLPMAIGSAIVRIIEVSRSSGGNGTGSAGRYIAGAWRYLFGGVLRRESSKEAHVAAWAFLVASSAIFGLAHAPGWGYWKVIPGMVAGLGFGYLFLRHGVGAGILAHFVNDYALSLSYEGIGGVGLEVVLTLLFVGLAIAGAGFLVWYAIDAWRHLSTLVAKFRPPTRAAVQPPPTPFAAPSPSPYPVPPTPSPGPPAGAWSPIPPVASPGIALREPGRIPRDYTPSYVPPPYGYPPVRFQCPFCGWVEARYDAGRFTCTRCGRTA